VSFLIDKFRSCAHQAGEFLNLGPSYLVRNYLLDDFLENALRNTDDGPTIVVKALDYFCTDQAPDATVFRWTVLTVGIFLNDCHGKRRTVPERALQDLLGILTANGGAAQIRRWIRSHFRIAR
jgi:hypothetical protein